MGGDEHVIVVGDRFVGEKTPSDVTGISQFESALRAGAYDQAEGCVVRLGQGIAPEQETALRAELARRGIERARVTLVGTSALRIAERGYVHKRRDDNVLISEIRELGAGCFEADLRIADQNELILDHVTGWHIPGMVILEATRQMCMAVVEQFFLPRSPDAPRTAFAVQRLESSFDSFLFPVESTISCTIEAIDTARTGRQSYRATLSVGQCQKATARVLFEFSVLDSKVFDAIEQKQAAVALHHLRTEPERHVVVPPESEQHLRASAEETPDVSSTVATAG